MMRSNTQNLSSLRRASRMVLKTASSPSQSSSFLLYHRTQRCAAWKPTIHQHGRSLHTTPPRIRQQKPPPTPPPTSFSELDVLGDAPIPATSVDVCTHDGFGLNSGATISGGDGTLLVNGRAFAWRPWEALPGGLNKEEKNGALRNEKGQFEVPREAFGLFDVMWPRPDLLVIGVGKHSMPLSPETRRHVSDMGMRVEVLDTRNAAAQFNLLATERGVSEVAAALVPVGWGEDRK